MTISTSATSSTPVFNDGIFDLHPAVLAMFTDFIQDYKAPMNEMAVFKGIPNNTFGKHMISIYRKYVIRTDFDVIRLKARAPNRQKIQDIMWSIKGYRQNTNQSIPLAYAKTFALYQHSTY